MAPPLELRTRRLLLRRWRGSDREAFAAMNADPEMMKHFLAPLSEGESGALLDRTRLHWAQHGFGPWAVEVLDGGAFAGVVGLGLPRFAQGFFGVAMVEIGWRLARSQWGQGYAVEAAHAAIASGFEEGLSEVVSFTANINTRSIAVMERLGMRRDPAEDFDHPNVPGGHPLRRHVLYRLARTGSRQLR